MNDGIELYSLDGLVVARISNWPAIPARHSYWMRGHEALSFERGFDEFLTGRGCQFPTPAFDPAGPYLAVCGDPPRTIVEVDPVTGQILQELSGPDALDAPTWRIRWATSGPEGEVIAQVGFECEVPVTHVLTEGRLRPLVVRDDLSISTFHLGWTENGDDLIQVLPGGCGVGLDPGVGTLSNGGGLNMFVPGEGYAFHWRALEQSPIDNQNQREIVLTLAINRLGLEQCCGHPPHDEVAAITAIDWQGQQLWLLATDLGIEHPISNLEAAYQIGRTRVHINTRNGNEAHFFACGDTTYRVLADESAVPVPTNAVEALVEALGCAG